MRMLLAALIAAWVAGTACDGGSDADMLAVIAESFPQSECAAVPLRFVDVPSGEVRLGPSDRWVTLAVSPPGDRVAAVRMNYDFCGPDVPPDEETFTLVMIDVSSLDVTELRTGPELVGNIHWSPNGEQLALVASFDVIVIDADSGSEVRRDPRGNGVTSLGAERSFLLWPEATRYLMVYIDGSRIVGLPRDATLPPTEWHLDCPARGRNPFRLRLDGPTTIAVDHYCTSEALKPDVIFEAAINLEDDSVGPREPSPEGEAWVKDTIRWYGAADDGFEGGMISPAPLSPRGDVTGQILFTTVAWSPSGTDLRELPRDEIPEGIEVKTTILIRDAPGETVEIPVELEYPMPLRTSSPLLDVTLLD